MPDVTMPRLSDSMEEGTILKWLKADGDEVRRGEELAEIETDKATMTFEADADGVLAIVANEGDTLAIGEVIARIGEGSSDGAASQEEPQAVEAQAVEPQAVEPPAVEREPEEAEDAGSVEEDGRAKASPVARRLAKERGVDLANVEGTGPGGRIVKADIEGAATGEAEPEPEPRVAAASAAQQPPRSEPAVTETGTAKGDVRVEEPTRVQQVVARRMAEAKATIPEFTLTTEVDMSPAVALRGELKAVAGADSVVPSYNDMVVKAAALALREFPRANGAYKDNRFELYSRVNVGVAVAAQDALVVPTIFDADKKTLGEIARDSRKLSARVRDGTVTPPELSGGTFTVSNLGMFGVTEFTAVINAPQSGILAVGALQEEPRVVDGEIVPRHVMRMTIVADHRILYGADAAQFLARIRALLEQPLGMAL